MISPHTPPGTKIIALRDVHDPRGVSLVGGQTYTVRAMRLEHCGPGIGVQLEGWSHVERRFLHWWSILPVAIPWAWRRELFRVAELPSCLTDCLTSAPVDNRVRA